MEFDLAEIAADIRGGGIRTFLLKMPSHLLGTILIRSIRRSFQKSIRGIRSLDEAVKFSYEFRILNISISPLQIQYEIKELLRMVSQVQPKIVLEIGTANGGTLFLWSRAADPNASLISLDLPGGAFGGGYPYHMVPLLMSMGKPHQEIHLIRADSHDPGTLARVKDLLAERKVDFLFIDGDHSYHGVKNDFEYYGPLVRKGGIIAFHDICPGPEEAVGGVPKFWSEVKGRFKYEAIIESAGQGGYGIGVLRV